MTVSPTCWSACAWREVGFEGALRPDHVPTVEGDSNDRPGYSSFGRLCVIDYCAACATPFAETAPPTPADIIRMI
jgi:D-mannonate dehydratase